MFNDKSDYIERRSLLRYLHNNYQNVLTRS